MPLEREDEPEDEPELEAFVPLPEPYVGAGPTGAELFGTATENGLFGVCVNLGACVFGGVAEGLKLGLNRGEGALTGCGFAGATLLCCLTGVLTGDFDTVVFGFCCCLACLTTFFGADEGDETDFLLGFEGAEGIDTTLLGS